VIVRIEKVRDDILRRVARLSAPAIAIRWAAGPICGVEK
jgi:hypothetical protein